MESVHARKELTTVEPGRSNFDNTAAVAHLRRRSGQNVGQVWEMLDLNDTVVDGRLQIGTDRVRSQNSQLKMRQSFEWAQLYEVQ